MSTHSEWKQEMKKRRQADKMRPAVVEARNAHYGSTCKRCGRRMPNVELAWNSIQHHNARALVCKDKRSCNRIARKNKRRELRRLRGR